MAECVTSTGYDGSKRTGDKTSMHTERSKTMTNEEAIKVLKHRQSCAEHREVFDAIDLAISALECRSEEDRRFVLRESEDGAVLYVWDKLLCSQIGYSWPNTKECRRAMLDIAGIYEQLYAENQR